MRPSASLVSMFAAAVLPFVAHGQSTARSEEQRVLAADDAYVKAETSRDEAALRRLVDDRFVFNASNAQTSGKEALIQRVMKWNLVGQTLSERSAMVEGDIAIVFGTTELRFADPGEPETVSRYRYTCVYAKRDGEWKMLVLQMQARAK